tara:strand:- start:2455 stop:5859 length:3405 start_codon:yes stop_codon:yes gene_type:complete
MSKSTRASKALKKLQAKRLKFNTGGYGGAGGGAPINEVIVTGSRGGSGGGVDMSGYEPRGPSRGGAGGPGPKAPSGAGNSGGKKTKSKKTEKKKKEEKEEKEDLDKALGKPNPKEYPGGRTSKAYKDDLAAWEEENNPKDAVLVSEGEDGSAPVYESQGQEPLTPGEQDEAEGADAGKETGKSTGNADARFGDNNKSVYEQKPLPQKGARKDSDVDRGVSGDPDWRPSGPGAVGQDGSTQAEYDENMDMSVEGEGTFAKLWSGIKDIAMMSPTIRVGASIIDGTLFNDVGEFIGEWGENPWNPANWESGDPPEWTVNLPDGSEVLSGGGYSNMGGAQGRGGPGGTPVSTTAASPSGSEITKVTSVANNQEESTGYGNRPTQTGSVDGDRNVGAGSVDVTGTGKSGEPIVKVTGPGYNTPEVEVETSGASDIIPDAPDPNTYRGGRTSTDYLKDKAEWDEEFAGAAERQALTTTSEEETQTLDDASVLEAESVVADEVVAEQAGENIEVSNVTDNTAATVEAKTVDTPDAVVGAKGTVKDEALAELDDATLTERAVAAKRDAEAEAAALADEVVYDVNKESYVKKVTGEVATVAETADAEAKTREAITGEPAPDGEAAEIMSMYEYNQLEKRKISKENVIKNLKNQGLKDKEIARRLADNPQLIADEMDSLPEDIKTTLSGLPQEALMSAQMESLMAGMEDGEIPAWARPALAKVEGNLAKRGMSASSIGRDALFNAIIQSAMPIAQNNAAAIQNATSQDKQIAADFLSKNAEFENQMNLANLSNDQQMRLANLTALNQAESENLSNAQQTELANLNTRMQTNLLQGKIASEMNQAQLNADQQRAVVNAQTNAGIDLAKFNAAQQVEITNSKFMQTMVANEFNADQQAAMLNASSMASMDLANLDKNAKLAVQNAQAFLQMDMANLSNEQQATVLSAQQKQQTMLSNQSATNAARQFNAANEQQADQFMQNLNTQINQYNSTANSARDQFNTTEKNRIAALNAGNKLQADQFSAQLEVDISKFNETQDLARDQWNASNAQAVEQSNKQWRRQANLSDTAAQNAANMQNAQMTFNLTSQELTQVWQQLRDEAAYIRQAFENEKQRKAQLTATAIGNEKIAAKNSEDAYEWVTNVSK